MTAPGLFPDLQASVCGPLDKGFDSKKRPLAIELFAGSMGWGRGLAAAGWRVIGFDIEHLPHHGKPPEHCSLVLQDVLTLHGSQFKDAQLIVASSPCQKYSWLAMPWSRSKDPENSKSAKFLRWCFEHDGPDNTLFNAARRIQREAIFARMELCRKCVIKKHDFARACGNCYIPLIQENVRGAQEWVGINGPCADIPRHERNRLGRAKANYGSFYLWGDIGMVGNRIVANGQQLRVPRRLPAKRAMDDLKNGKRSAALAHLPVGNGPLGRNDGTEKPGIRHEDRAGIKGLENDRPTQPDGTGGTSWFGGGKRSDPRDVRRNETGAYEMPGGTKIGGDWFSDPNSTCRKHGSRSNARKAASAAIAVIPFELAEFVGKAFFPK